MSVSDQVKVEVKIEDAASSSNSPVPVPVVSANSNVITNNQMNQMLSMMQQMMQAQQQVFQALQAKMIPSNNPFVPSPSPTSVPLSASVVASSPNIHQHTSSAPLLPISSKVKISPPSHYTGNRNVNVETWLFEMNQYLDITSVTKSSQRISVASSYFKESALQWWVNQCHHAFSPIDSWTWQQFTTAVRDRFQPLAASRTARAQLRNLRQANMSVSDYSHKFLQIVQLITDMSEVDQTELFIYGLRNHLSREVDMKEPRTLQEAMTMAQKVETLLDNHRSHFSPNEPRSFSQFSRRPAFRPLFSTASNRSVSSNTYGSGTSSSTPMEINNVQATPFTSDSSCVDQEAEPDTTSEKDDEYQRYLQEGDNYEPDYDIWQDSEEQLQVMHMQQRMMKPAHLSQEEFNRCMESRLCFKCKKQGHPARLCPLRPQTSSAASSSNKSRHFQ
jgi:hypothetical protein